MNLVMPNIVALSFMISLGHSLTCQSGEHFKISFIPIDTMVEKQCQGVEARCLRIQANVKGEFPLVGEAKLSATVGQCTTEAMCKWDCESLVRQYVSKLHVNKIDLSSVNYSIRECKSACCDSDSCNFYDLH